MILVLLFTLAALIAGISYVIVLKRKPLLDIPSQGRVIVVSGAAGGFGSLTCKELLDKWQCRVIAIDINQQFLEEKFKTELSSEKTASRLQLIECDITKVDHVERAAKEIRQTLSNWNADSIFALVNNAGIANAPGTKKRCGIVEYSEEDLQQVFGVNLFGHVRMLRELYPQMTKIVSEKNSSNEKNHSMYGSIVVNIASVAGLVAPPFFGFYTSSKFAMVGLSDSLRREFKAVKNGMRLTCVEPGFSRTNILNLKPFDENSEYHDIAVKKQQDAKRFIDNAQDPAHVSSAICQQIFSSNNVPHLVIDHWYMKMVWYMLKVLGMDGFL
ncbi:hypothetical protein C9374_013606 [Naegleria lovaniensis]|uniref:Uncharacterized protein n=1 Tax=Naegleria lovaniensis TaxID=51637 RepID=A0AA88G5K0_NAELO|nr:uncharacterized protein C9374_013605 [Naegleria lovaniensis]XP_044541880.1 uncharacterized protein C9374_013606 [Naegleria lovaniensis]KAG2372704.1 hypothetical protein C9374_013605 [Naegleria lovaniensis]KAG2372705.1 hypothetical protein C9374_013606 [Naegleria lovaniensis]